MCVCPKSEVFKSCAVNWCENMVITSTVSSSCPAEALWAGTTELVPPLLIHKHFVHIHNSEWCCALNRCQKAQHQAVIIILVYAGFWLKLFYLYVNKSVCSVLCGCSHCVCGDVTLLKNSHSVYLSLHTRCCWAGSSSSGCPGEVSPTCRAPHRSRSLNTPSSRPHIWLSWWIRQHPTCCTDLSITTDSSTVSLSLMVEAEVTDTSC